MLSNHHIISSPGKQIQGFGYQPAMQMYTSSYAYHTPSSSAPSIVSQELSINVVDGVLINNNKIQPPRESFKSRDDGEEARKHRDELSISIRKVKRDNNANLKRKCHSVGNLNINNQDEINNGKQFISHESSSMDDDIDESKTSSHVEYNASVPVSRNAVMISERMIDLSSNDESKVFDATMWFRKILSIEKDPPIDEIIDAGVVPRLLDILSRTKSNDLQFEASWALTNIASGTTDHTKAVVDAGAIKVFVQLLSCGSPEVCEQAVWVLGNIAGDSTQFRDMVLHARALPVILNLSNRSHKTSFMRNIAWTISNLCRGKPLVDHSLVASALPLLISLIKRYHDEELLLDATWGLSYMSDSKMFQFDVLIESGIIAKLIDFLYHSNPLFVSGSLRMFGNLIKGTNSQTQAAIEAGLLPALLQLLDSSHRVIVKEVCWTLSNITAGTPSQIEAVIESNLIPPLIETLKFGDIEIRKEAAWAICNACSDGIPSQVKYIVSMGCIRPLCDQLLESEVKLVKVALEALEHILRVGARQFERYPFLGENEYARFVDEAGGLDKIEQLQSHPNRDIYTKASHMIQTYYAIEEDTDVAMTTNAPDVDAESNMYRFSSSDVKYAEAELQNSFACPLPLMRKGMDE